MEIIYNEDGSVREILTNYTESKKIFEFKAKQAFDKNYPEFCGKPLIYRKQGK